MEEVNALKHENNALKEMIKNMRAENKAIDQVAGMQLRDNVQLRTQIQLAIEDNTEKANEIETLKKEIDDWKNKCLSDTVEKICA